MYLECSAILNVLCFDNNSNFYNDNDKNINYKMNKLIYLLAAINVKAADSYAEQIYLY